jgi:hypothetical protein
MRGDVLEQIVEMLVAEHLQHRCGIGVSVWCVICHGHSAGRERVASVKQFRRTLLPKAPQQGEELHEA